MTEIHLTVEQIEALYHLALHRNHPRYGRVAGGVSIYGDANGRSTVNLVASHTDHDNCMTIIEPDGATPGWER